MEVFSSKKTAEIKDENTKLPKQFMILKKRAIFTIRKNLKNQNF